MPLMGCLGDESKIQRDGTGRDKKKVRKEKVFRRRYREIQGEEVRKFLLLLLFLGDYVNLPNT